MLSYYFCGLFSNTSLNSYSSCSQSALTKWFNLIIIRISPISINMVAVCGNCMKMWLPIVEVAFNRVIPQKDVSPPLSVSHLLQNFTLSHTCEIDGRMLGALLPNRKLVMDGKSNCSGESPKPHILTVLKELHKAPGYFRYKIVSCGVTRMLQRTPVT